ncbi:MAG: GerMN domain-containing protein [Coprococcus sp.]
MRYRWRWPMVLLLICATAFMGGCQSIKYLAGSHKTGAEPENTGTGYNIYYINNDETKLRAVGYQLVSTTEDGIIQECLEALEMNPEDKNYKPVIAAPVRIERYSYDKDSRTLSLYFYEEYNQMSKTSEMLVRAAIVKTLTQFSGIIDYVSFNVGGEWMADEEGNTLRMKNADYISEITSNLDHLEDANLCLYFASEDGSGLIRTYTTLKYYDTAPMAAVVLDALLRGPTVEGCCPVLSANTQVKNVYVKEGVCQVDFNQGFLEKIGDQDFKLNVYGVVNSLTELKDVDKVQITVDGQVVAEAPDGVLLMDILTAKPDMVKE